MAHFSLSLLGAYRAVSDGKPVERFGSVKTQALLAFLAIEADRPHRRDSLAGLLWPEEPDGTARNNLRHALSMLRQAVGDRRAAVADAGLAPLLLVSRESVQFDCSADCWVDVHAFRALVGAGHEPATSVEELERAIALYRGDFLEGFYVSDSAAFDDWAMLERDRLQRQAASALRQLVEAFTARGQVREACAYAWRWVELEPWQESAYQQLMTVLALSGQRTEALARFEVCCKMLQAEYGAGPSKRTLDLWACIRDGRLSPPAGPDSEPAAPAVLPEIQGFVARERELGALERHLAAAMEGSGRVVLVAGEAGQGKTALIQAFVHAAQRAHPRLLVAGGNCNAYTGLGDPYLPFREILELLTGDVHARAASLNGDHARRLQEALPWVARAVADHGRDLIDVFVPGEALLRRLDAVAGAEEPWGAALGEVVARRASEQQPGMQQQDLYEQVTKVFTAVARQAPLLVVIDDLQWADPGTIGLLFHLGRRLTGSRLLLVGAYRSEEVGAGRDGARHPLEAVINEFRRIWGDNVIDLHEAESRQFVEAMLDSEPNDLGGPFRETLYRQTGGHALFTVELLRGMQERGDLVKDAEGRWVVGSHLDWSILPARIEAVIGERIGRLAEPLRTVLKTASVEGEVFTAEAVARTQDEMVRIVIDGLSGELDRIHRLVRAVGIQRVDGQRLSQYRFRHILFQTYLYGSLDEIERAHLHERVGEALEELYQGSEEALAGAAPQLALQFERAGLADRAVVYYELAGQRAIRMLAHEEAVGHLARGIELLAQLPPSAERDARELRLRLAVAMPIFVLKSWGAEELVDHYRRAE
ncbi:MAG: AAA family ATPase, partial [Anaerolineae bacterium]|nr:AAA family ATPase [Anaerolineae bacterium]